MASRSLRARKPVDYCDHNQSSEFLENSTDEEDNEAEAVFPEEAPVEDLILSSSDEEEPPEVEAETVFSGKDGTLWTTRVPRAPLDAWRFGLKDFQDGPKNEAKVQANANISKLDIFKMMLTEDTTQNICNWTNNWAHFCVRNWNKLNTSKKPKLWRDVTTIELRRFFGLIILGGVEKPSKKPWAEMWTKNSKYSNPAFVGTMSQDRFSGLMSVIRFDDAIERHRLSNVSKASKSNEDQDKLQPIREIFEAVTSRFADLYTPASKLCIDEQLVKFRGKCPFRVYLPSKPGKYGIKIWGIVDNASGYILNLIVYTGKEGNQREVIKNLVIYN